MSEIATGRSNRPWRRAVVPVVAVLLAVLAGGMLLWAIKGHQTSPSAIPVAIVNNDAPVTTGSGNDQKTVAAGRLLAANLSEPSPSTTTPLSWQLMDADDAAAGLQDGSFYGVLTIPQDFSAAITSTSGTTPQQAKLQLVTDDSASAAVAALAQLTVDQAALTLGQQVTSSYVDQLLQSMTSIHNSLSSSASSAQTLASSSDELASSSQQLADSTGQVASGADSLDQGSSSLAAGAATLSSGAAQTATGAAQVAQGTRSLATAAGQLDQGAEVAAAGAATLSTTAQRVSTGATVLANQTGELASGMGRVDDDARRHADVSTDVADRAQEVADACPATVDRAYCDRVSALATESRLESDGARALRLAVGVETARSAVVSRGAQGLATANAGLAGGAAQLATGTSQVSSGADALSTAAGRLSTGASGVATGTSQVATGAAQTSAGASSLATGAAQLASGTEQLAGGSNQLASGAEQLAGGNEELATGLANGAQQVPSYTDNQRNALVSVVTTPVDVGSTADNPATVAASLVPVVLGLVLWVGTLMLFLTGTPVPDGPAWSQASPWRRVLARWLPAALVGVLQAAVVIALVAVSGVSISSPVGLVGIGVLGAVAFAATNQALVSMFGGVGRMVSLAFVAVQAAAFGGLVPIETAPAALQTLNGVLPLPQFVAGASRFLLGGGGDVVSPCLVLIGWTVMALLVSVAFTARRRPELAGVARPPSTAGPTLSLAAEGT
jgi:putative membrane protein